ncbi:hypothetical protein [Denitromonas iodatirespirans]|uniref:Uncharacterized protein n=1 Tax=Denitromonas iodatirespirans TaxID=2795389 RepID=A0A944HEG0_DENI1|nr:hypothetical protein [Denitromonas iodatirespirans]MBT0962861.1 hypothetical protein [Denitromonas iodatirespirans]
MASKKPHPRLPVASFPALVSKLGDAKSFGISLPTGSGLWGFGASEERNLYYTLSIPLAEVNELPRVQFLQQLAKQNTPEQKEMWAKAKAIRTDFSKAYREVCQEVRLAVVRQTYATRRFSVSLSADRAGALGGQMQMALGKERAKVVEALAAYASDDAQADNQGNQSANSKDAEISRLRKALLAKDLALDLGFPGVRGESANSSETSVKLEYVFDVPVVFAVATLWEQEIGDPPGEGGPPPGVSPNGPDILNKKNAEGVK